MQRIAAYGNRAIFVPTDGGVSSNVLAGYGLAAGGAAGGAAGNASKVYAGR